MEGRLLLVGRLRLGGLLRPIEALARLLGILGREAGERGSLLLRVLGRHNRLRVRCRRVHVIVRGGGERVGGLILQ